MAVKWLISFIGKNKKKHLINKQFNGGTAGYQNENGNLRQPRQNKRNFQLKELQLLMLLFLFFYCRVLPSRRMHLQPRSSFICNGICSDICVLWPYFFNYSTQKDDQELIFLKCIYFWSNFINIEQSKNLKWTI